MVLLGQIVASAFFPKKKFGKIRGDIQWTEWPWGSAWTLVSYHPSAFLGGGKYKFDIADFARDMLKIQEVVTWPIDGSHRPWEVPFELVEDPARAEQVLWHEIDGLVHVDVETTYDGKSSVYEQLRPAAYPEYGNGKLLCVGFADARGTYVIPGDVISHVTQGWHERSGVRFGMHLSQFDRAQIYRMLGVKLKISEDTLLQSYTLDERGGAAEENVRPVGIHGLKKLAREYLGVPDWDVSVLEAEPDDLHAYNARDVRYEFALQGYFERRQIADGVRDVYERLLIPGVNAVSEMQDRGVAIDKSVLHGLAIRWGEREEQLWDELMQGLKIFGWEGPLNFKSPKQMASFVYDYLGVPVILSEGRTTKAFVLDQLAEMTENPWLSTLGRHRQIVHLLETYIVGIEDDLKWDGRIHPEPLIHGTRGGRLSYHRPPVQTIPHHGVAGDLTDVRAMFTADVDNGFFWMEADLKQAELWATWMYTVRRFGGDGDRNLYDALASGDVHGATAKDVFGADETHEFWDTLRYLTKTINFGILYGRGAKSFVDDMYRGHQPPAGLDVLRWDYGQARRAINKWAETYPLVWQWRQEETRDAFENGEQQSWTGRKRRYWLPDEKVLTQSVNFGPQSFAHDCLFDSMIKLHEALAKFDSYVLFEVHDAVMIEARIEYAPEVFQLVQDIMTEPKFGAPRGIPVDIAVGPNMNETRKCPSADKIYEVLLGKGGADRYEPGGQNINDMWFSLNRKDRR